MRRFRRRPAWHDLPGPILFSPAEGLRTDCATYSAVFRAVSARHDRAIKLSGYYRRLGIAALARGRPTEGAFFCALLTRLSALLQMASKPRPQSVAAANLASSCFDDAVNEYQPAEKWIVMKSMFISVAMLLALSVPALADNDKNKGDNGGVRGATGQVEITIEADDELRLIVRRRAASGSMTNMYDHTFLPVYKAAAAKRIKKGTPAEAKANAKPSVARNM